jgi:hypothetical protein
MAKFADMTAKDTAKEHGWQLKEATAYQRHRKRQRLATGAWRDFHENNIARLPYFVDPSTECEYARTLHHLQPPGLGREVESREKQHSRTPLGRVRAGSGRLSRGPHALWRPPPRPRSPQPRLRERE